MVNEGEYGACPEPPKPFVNILEDGFGFITNDNGEKEIVRRYTFTNQNNLTIQIITYGGAITSIKYPDRNGVLDDVVLGFDDLRGYLSPLNPYFGAIIGRFANRIAKGHFKIGNADYQLSRNNGEHHLHGGFKGFDKVNWKSDIQENKVVMTYMSKDGEEGYPGEVLVSVSYEMTPANDLVIEMKATSSKPTPVNLTHHSYFNLAGHAAGASGLLDHIVTINADRYCHTDEEFIPSGMLKNVVNTFWDLRIGRRLGSVLAHLPYGGYDQNMCIHKTNSECLAFVARVVHPESGRTLEVYSNQLGVQFYTANYLPIRLLSNGEPIVQDKDKDIKGKKGVHYYKHQAFCLETQNFPDAVNHTADGCRLRKCPLCGQIIRDSDFENIPDEDACYEEHSSGDIEIGQVKKLIGKDGIQYYKHAAFCLMTQKFPDPLHHKNFPNAILKPGDSYYHIVKYKFGLCEEVDLQPEEEDFVVDEETEEELIVEEEQEEDDLIETKLEENGR